MDKIFKAFADVNRRKILTFLKDKEYSVNELLANFYKYAFKKESAKNKKSRREKC
jgi:DNA-binding transcriptional ArsR family regulator